ncbi:MAG: 3-isopropylmalate dehydratase small subunit [Gammaproteobacteria bacterium]|nr:3-isopropylmalate dehydratase small subunit [Gammaproteobacteria bacterium]|tara:strand:+ start:220 stop:795 length:576 start_codon:yes stop_codon:yes gene_type:complete
MKPIKIVCGKTVALPNKDIDTDQIIAARYLTTTTKDGLGKYVFHDLRFDKDGNEKQDFILNHPSSKGCSILIGGNNFGCGSSREHAPWALVDFGFKAVISTEIADIFRSNSLKTGLISIVIDAESHKWLLQNPGIELKISIIDCNVELPDGRKISFNMEQFARHCLLEGIDQLGFLQQQLQAIEVFEENRN